jgi:hypothetical protein
MTRHANAARIGQTFQPSSDVHAVTENVAVLDDDIANIDAHSKFDAAGARQTVVTVGHVVLPFGRAAQTVYYTGELDEQAIPGRFHYSPMMSGDFRIDDLSPNRL